MRRYHILCNFEKKDASHLENYQIAMTSKQGLPSFCNLIKLMLNAKIQVLMAHLCFTLVNIHLFRIARRTPCVNEWAIRILI